MISSQFPGHSAVARAATAIRRDPPGRVAEKIARWLARPLMMYPAGRRLSRLAAEADGAEALVDLAFGFRFALDGIDIAPWQERSEILGLVRLLERDPPHAVLEIGTAGGGTLFLLTRIAAPGAVVVSVDLPAGMFGPGYRRSRIPLYRSFAREDESLHLLRGDSHHAQVAEKVRNVLDGRPLDLLFIDGDHTYDGVRADFEMYAPLVRPGGLIAFHDIVPGAAAIGEWVPGHRVGDVPRFWREIRERHETLEFVHDWDQGGLGLGVVVAGSERAVAVAQATEPATTSAP